MDNQLMETGLNQVARQEELNHTEFMGFIQELTEPATVHYCSMKPQTQQEKIALYNAMNNPKHRVIDFVNKEINLKNVYVEMVTLTNEKTGEIQTAPRIVLIDDKNVGYACVSMVVFSALKKLFMVCGTPEDWEKPVKIEIKEINKGAGDSVRRLLTFNLV